MVFHSLGSVSLFILIFCFFPLLTWTGKYCSSCFQNTFGFLVFSEYKMGAIGQKRIKLLQNTRKPWNKQGVFVSNRLKAILSDKMALLISIFNYHVQAFNLTYSKQDSLFQRESFFFNDGGKCNIHLLFYCFFICHSLAFYCICLFFSYSTM